MITHTEEIQGEKEKKDESFYYCIYLQDVNLIQASD